MARKDEKSKVVATYHDRVENIINNMKPVGIKKELGPLFAYLTI